MEESAIHDCQLVILPERLNSIPPKIRYAAVVADLGWTDKELRKLRSLKHPYGIQKFLDNMPYHLANTSWSPRVVLREDTSHCLEGAILAAAALRANGFPPPVFAKLKKTASKEYRSGSTPDCLGVFPDRCQVHGTPSLKSSFRGQLSHQMAFQYIRTCEVYLPVVRIPVEMSGLRV